MSESGYWGDHVRPALAPFGVLTRIENAVDLGTPDVAYCLRLKPLVPAVAGWIELKVLENLPARGSTPVRIDHLTWEQVRWGEMWVEAGGLAWMLLRAGDRHILMKPPWPRRIFKGEVTAPDLVNGADAFGIGKFPKGKVLKCLTNA